MTLEPGPTVMYHSHPPNPIATKAKMVRFRRALLFLRFLTLEFFVVLEVGDFFAAGALITFSLTGAVGVEATGGAISAGGVLGGEACSSRTACTSLRKTFASRGRRSASLAVALRTSASTAGGTFPLTLEGNGTSSCTCLYAT
ncbi:unannotated protein [freshwater metagenome]|uniref:Unannotated protein n=1 Tax=freshwater metagenome TaxID=449393 RepID=A0A6J6WJZ7_9ZZZZ